MSFVLDASTTLAWHFEDEASAEVRALAHRAFADGVAVPQHWLLEVISALLRGERRNRSAPAQSQEFVTFLQDLDAEIDDLDQDRAVSVLLPLARDQRLSLYDAAYLELADRRRLPMATLDASLIRAANAIGVELILGS
ncbi:MAG: type II toxin-antitoxin system VapC family toxin [Allosphingosinicella sp.]